MRIIITLSCLLALRAGWYDPNDGGLDVSDDGGLTWRNRSKGLAVTMYYDMDEPKMMAVTLAEVPKTMERWLRQMAEAMIISKCLAATAAG